MTQQVMTTKHPQPVLFLSHGGGPSFFLDAKDFPAMKGLDKHSKAAEFLQNLTKHAGMQSHSRPEAILVFSAHWAEGVCCVSNTETTSLYYDYGGFPPETYKIQWPVPGSPSIAKKVVELLKKHGISCKENSSRGLDHGVFVPLKLAFPQADIPVLQVSLLRNMDINDHMKIAEALAEIRQENVLIIGSGFGTHAGMRHSSPSQGAIEMKELLDDVVMNPTYSAVERKSKLISLTNQNCFKEAHSPPDHFLPLAMCFAVAGYKAGKILLSEFAAGSLLNAHFMFE